MTAPVIDTPRLTVEELSSLSRSKKFQVAFLYLNVEQQLVQKKILSAKSNSLVEISAQQVFAPALRLKCTNLVIARNSIKRITLSLEQEIKLIKQIQKAGEILEIQLVDYVIVSEYHYFSFRENKLL